jgi:hypothetical protein
VTHAAHGQESHMHWLLSPWDHQVHAFPDDKIGDVTAEAICTHSALVSRLSNKDGRKCLGCVLLYGDELTGRHGEATWRG